jgi:hypothetical protein
MDIKFQNPKCAEWDVGALIKRFHSFTGLKLLAKRGANQILCFRSSPQFQEITTLHLDFIEDIDTLSIIPMLPQLSRLECHCTRFTEPPATKRRICSPLLRTLLLWWCTNESWLSSLSCPSLTTFIHDGEGFPTSFLRSHRSVVALECVLGCLNSAGPDILKEIESIVPELKWLSLDTVEFLGNRQKARAGTPPFPRLEHLTVCDRISLEEFEDIVKTRCLPVGNSKSRLSACLKPLKTLSFAGYDEITVELASSQLFESAAKHVAVYPYWHEFEALSLSWL